MTNRFFRWAVLPAVLTAVPLIYFQPDLRPKTPPRYDIVDRSDIPPIEPETPSFRDKIWLNGDWDFRPRGEKKWRRVQVPHVWNVEPGLERWTGVAEYRRAFDANPDWKEKRIVLRFEGVNHSARVFVNGKECGGHAGGYTPFEIDATEFIDFKKKNQLLVKVDNRLGKDTAPDLIGWNNDGGIFREVSLETRPPNQFSFLHVCAVDLRPDGPTLKIAAGVRLPAAPRVKGIFNIIGPGLKRPIEFSHDLWTNGEPEAVVEFTQKAPGLKAWSPERPILYRLNAVMISDDFSVDGMSVEFGARTLSLDGGKLNVNGKPVYLRGVSRHEDTPGLGRRQTLAIMEKDLALMRDAGFNAVRTGHYPPHPSFLDLCDRLGMLVLEEIPVWNSVETALANSRFRASAVAQMNEMARRDFNHPSVVMWGAANEIAGESREAAQFIKEVKAAADSWDSGRPVYYASRKFTGDRASQVADVLALNAYFGWYYGQPSDLGKTLDAGHKKNPGKALFLTEYGAGGVEGYKGGRKWAASWQNAVLAGARTEIDARPWMAGDFIWHLFDFRDPGIQIGPLPGFNKKGLVDYNREPKPVYALVSRWNRSGLEKDEAKTLERDAKPRVRFAPHGFHLTLAALAALLLLGGAAKRGELGILLLHPGAIGFAMGRKLSAMAGERPVRQLDPGPGFLRYGGPSLVLAVASAALFLQGLAYGAPLNTGFLGEAMSARLAASLNDPASRLLFAAAAVFWFASVLAWFASLVSRAGFLETFELLNRNLLGRTATFLILLAPPSQWVWLAVPILYENALKWRAMRSGLGLGRPATAAVFLLYGAVGLGGPALLLDRLFRIAALI